MLIYLLIFIAIFFFVAWNLNVTNKAMHAILSTISTILLFLGFSAIIANFHQHAWMHHETTTQTSKVSSMSPQMPMSLYQKIGTSGNEQALIYKVGNKRVVLKPDTDVKNKIVQNSSVKTPHLVTKTTRWKYNSSFSKLMFDAGQKQVIDHKTQTLYLPEDWLSITPKQAKKLPVIMKQQQAMMSSGQAKARMAAVAKSTAQQAVMQAAKQNPKLSASQKAQIAKRAILKYQSQVQQQAIVKLLPTLKTELAKVK